MSNSIEIEGMDEFTEILEEMTITEEDGKKAMRKAIKPIKEGLEKDTPKDSGKLAKVKTSVKSNHLSIIGTVRLGAWWDKFQEFGTSFQKKNVGFFERSVSNTGDEAVGILGKELLDKAK